MCAMPMPHDDVRDDPEIIDDDPEIIDEEPGASTMEEDHPTPEIISILLGDVVVDFSYQRALIPAHLNKLKAEWDDRAAGTLTVNFREDGTMILVDGCHRANAAKARGYTSWAAYAYEGLTREQEADLFLRLNNLRRSHTSVGKWNASIAARKPLHLVLERILAEHGLTVALNKVSKGDPTKLGCPDTLVSIATRKRKESPERVRIVLDFIMDMWPDDPLHAHARTLNGVERFLDKYGGLLDMASARSKFRPASLKEIHKRAATLADAHLIDNNRCFCTALQEVYDSSRRTHRLEPKDSD